MRSVVKKAALGVVLGCATLGLGACATEGYVDKAVAGVQSQVTEQQAQLQNTNQQVASNTAAIGQHAGRLAKLDTDTQQALASAQDAQAKYDKGRFQDTQLASETIYFKSGSDKLSKEEQAKLTDLANRLKIQNKNVHVEVLGYADSRGGPGFNEKLAARRADSVYQFLGEQGLPLNTMEMMSHGENNPKAPNNTSDGRQQNRRVVISVMG
jgi:peptidoglycan-associated lipoprotein